MKDKFFLFFGIDVYLFEENEQIGITLLCYVL